MAPKEEGGEMEGEPIRVSRDITFEKLFIELGADIDGFFEKRFQFDTESPPVLTVKVKGEKFVKALTVPFMQALIEVQKDFRHAFALAKYGDAKKKLSLEDKRATEIKFEIEEGSTWVSILPEWGEIVQSLGLKEVIANMSADQFLSLVKIIAGTIILGQGIFAVQSLFRRLIEKKERTEIQSIEADARTAHDNAMIKAFESGIDSRERFIKKAAVSDIDELSIGEDSYPRETIQKIRKIRRPRKEKSTHMRHGRFFVKDIHFSMSSENDDTIDLLTEKKDEIIKNVVCPKGLMTDEQFALINKSIGGESLDMYVYIRLKDNEIDSALLHSVKFLDIDQDD